MTLAAGAVEEGQQSQLAITQLTLGNLAEDEILAQGSTKDVTLTIVVCGDVHPAAGGDGDVDVLDALRTLKIAVGLVTADVREQISGDIHPAIAEPAGDGTINVLDALRTLNGAVGQVNINSCGGPI